MRARVLALDALTRGQRDGWRELAARAAEPNPFFEEPAVRDAAALLPLGDRVGVLLVEDGEEVLLALPVLRRARPRRVPVPALQSWQHVHCFAGVPLVRAGRVREAWREALDHLRHAGGEPWLVLPRLPVLAPVGAGLLAELDARHALPGLGDRFGRPVVRRRPQATYLDGRLSARHRKALRRQRRLLEAQRGAPVSLVDLAAAGRGGEGVEAFLGLEARGWKGAAGTALACRPAEQEWFRRFCAALDAQGRLETWVLGPPSAPAAVQVHARAGSTVFHVKTTYDEAVARTSPGMQMEVELVQRFHDDARLQTLDSCVDPDNRVSAQLYPDREPLATVAVPLRLPGGPVAVAAWVAAGRARDLRRRLRPPAAA